MIASIRAEFRKLLTVRSTYVLSAVCLAFAALIGFYILGFRASSGTSMNPDALTSAVTTTISITSLFIALAGVLLITHEYRYNTIMYTLTAARRRWYTLVSKTLVVTLFSVVATVILCLIVPQLMKLGLHMHHVSLVHQNIDYGVLLPHAIFYVWGNVMFGLIISFILRSQVGAIVVLLVFPAIVENLLTLLLKHNSIYLPFQSLTPVLTDAHAAAHQLSAAQGMLVALTYVVVGWIVSLVLLQKRDAN